MKKLKLTLVMLGLSLSTYAMGDGFSWHANLGYASPKLSNSTSDVWMVGSQMENQYTTTTAQSNAIIGTGLAYQWDMNPVAINLGASVYYMATSVSGVATPFINVPGIKFDTLNYTASGQSYAFMIEPKLILTTYSWQPYIMVGMGLGINNLNDYNETSNGENSPGAPFNSKTTNNFAYEAGIGVQHALTSGKNAPLLAIDYRYMNWGDAGLSEFTGQNTNSTLDFGKLSTGVAMVSLIWPF